MSYDEISRLAWDGATLVPCLTVNWCNGSAELVAVDERQRVIGGIMQHDTFGIFECPMCHVEASYPLPNVAKVAP